MSFNSTQTSGASQSANGAPLSPLCSRPVAAALGLVVCAVLAGCGTAPTAPGAVAAAEGTPAECLQQAAPTGSNIVRKDRVCVAMTEQDRELARRQLQEMRDRQALDQATRMATPTGPTGR